MFESLLTDVPVAESSCADLLSLDKVAVIQDVEPSLLLSVIQTPRVLRASFTRSSEIIPAVSSHQKQSSKQQQKQQKEQTQVSVELSEMHTLTASLLTVQVEEAPTTFPTHLQLLHQQSIRSLSCAALIRNTKFSVCRRENDSV